MSKNPTLQMGNGNHRRSVPHLVEMVRAGHLPLIQVLTGREPLISVIEAMRRSALPGWIKVALRRAV